MNDVLSLVRIPLGCDMQAMAALFDGAGETCLWGCLICCMAPFVLFLIVFIIVLVRRIVRIGRRRKALARKKAGKESN